MLTKLLSFIAGREPVATATGVAAIITAGAGVLTAFDVLSLSPEQIAAIGALAVALAGWLGRRAVTPVASRIPRVVDERGGIGKGLAIFVVVVGLGFAACLAIADDNETDSLGRVELVSHDYDDRGCWEGECYDGRGGDGGDSGGHQGYGGGGGRSGDYDGGPGDDCRNACGNTIIVPSPDGGREGQRV